MRRDDDFFWAGIDAGRLLAQRCESCGTLRHPPSPMCGQCGSLDWSPQPLSGRGTVFSWLIGRHPTDQDTAPRTILLVHLAEGLRIVSNLKGGGDARIGEAVTFATGEIDGVTLPLFERAAP